MKGCIIPSGTGIPPASGTGRDFQFSSSLYLFYSTVWAKFLPDGEKNQNICCRERFFRWKREKLDLPFMKIIPGLYVP